MEANFFMRKYLYSLAQNVLWAGLQLFFKRPLGGVVVIL